MIEKEVRFEGAGGLRLHGVLRLPDEEGSFPAIIVCHGFMARKTHEFLISLANELSYNRFAVLRFDFLHHGESEGDLQKMTISQQIEDVKDAVDFLNTIPQVDRNKVGIIGHGLGGTVALLTAADDKRFKAVATISATAHIDRKIRRYFSEHQIEEWKKTGYIETGLYNLQRIKSSFLDDAYKHDVLSAVPCNTRH
jgi:cephalosporin-C deacetylase-like acetyl esterase